MLQSTSRLLEDDNRSRSGVSGMLDLSMLSNGSREARAPGETGEYRIPRAVEAGWHDPRESLAFGPCIKCICIALDILQQFRKFKCLFIVTPSEIIKIKRTTYPTQMKTNTHENYQQLSHTQICLVNNASHRFYINVILQSYQIYYHWSPVAHLPLQC